MVCEKNKKKGKFLYCSLGYFWSCMTNTRKAILIGNGTMGRRHRSRFEACGVRFVDVLDIDAEKRLEKSDFSPEKVDFAVVASPAATHYHYVKFLLERKIPVLVEKPLATTAREAMELVDLSLRNDTLLFVAQSECYNPLFLNFRKHLLVDLRNAVAASKAACKSELGEGRGHAPLNVKLEFRREHGFSERCRDVDVSLDLLVHDVSLFLNLFEANDVMWLEENSGCGCDGNGDRCGCHGDGGCGDSVHRTAKVVSGEFAGVVAEFYANRSSERDIRQISVEFGRNGNMSGFDYSVSLARYTAAGTVDHIPDSLDNEHRFFLKLLASACKDWARRALMNAAQSIVFISR